jgi:hypothetical protein
LKTTLNIERRTPNFALRRPNWFVYFSRGHSWTFVSGLAFLIEQQWDAGRGFRVAYCVFSQQVKDSLHHSDTLSNSLYIKEL